MRETTKARWHAPNSIDKARMHTRPFMKRAGLTRADIDARFGEDAWQDFDQIYYIRDVLRLEELVRKSGAKFQKVLKKALDGRQLN